MNRIKLGMVGGGEGSLIGVVHRIAAYMGERYTLVGGVFNSTHEKSLEFAKRLELDESRVYDNVDMLISQESKKKDRMQVITIATPNNLHFEAARKLLNAGFHIICEKPITLTADEAEELKELVEKNQLVFGVAHTYTGYPMVRQMKEMIKSGELGAIQKIDAQYYQGWINPFIHDKDRRAEIWRLNPETSGISCCMGDIGVHAFNMIEYTTGRRVKKVLADLDSMYDDNPLDIDGTVVLRMEDETRGILRASQVATGEENNFRIAVYGREGALKWEQENPNYLTFLRDGQPIQVLKPGNPYTADLEKLSVKLPAGHPEGIFDAMGNIYNGVASAINGEKYPEGAFPGIEDGVRGMKFIETVVSSSAQGNIWKTIT